MPTSISRVLICLVCIAASFVQPSFAANADAEALTDRMLERLGGRDNWAALRNTTNSSLQYRAAAPTEVLSTITMDFDQPRFRIETTGPDVYLVRVINGEHSWRISWDGKVTDLPEARYKDDLLWYEAHIYRTLVRIARRDQALALRVTEKNRLEIYSGEGRLMWLQLNADAEPYAYGFRDDNKGSLCGPWNLVTQGIHQPSWVSNSDGTWRATARAVHFNVDLHETTFNRPVKKTFGQNVTIR